MTSQKVSIEEAVKRLMEVDANNSSKISKLEGEIDEIYKAFTEYREQNTSSTKDELQNMSERIDSIQSLTTAYQNDANNKYEESKQQLNRMYTDMNSNMDTILKKLNEITGPTASTSTMMENDEARAEEYGTKQNTIGKTTKFMTNLVPGHTFQITAPTNNLSSGHTFQTALD
jgi:phage shock protein A